MSRLLAVGILTLPLWSFVAQAQPGLEPCPEPIVFAVPHYPGLDRIQARASGSVDVRVRINRAGIVRKAEAVSSVEELMEHEGGEDYRLLYELLISAAEEAAAQWLFAERDRRMDCSVKFVFTLVRNSKPNLSAVTRPPSTVEIFAEHVPFTVDTAPKTEGQP